MSQKGGTYPTSSEIVKGVKSELSFRSFVQKLGNFEGKALVSTHKTTCEEASHLYEGRDNDDEQQWELVNIPDENEGADSYTTCFEHYFEFNIGRGWWKFTLFSWDVKIGRPQRED
ncbi:hypothetical protein F5Y03DRAFT_399379 [Xylaria venustula]|nr:hypothetical protein F5Y03DRAFT_399379 [Xylaria venustula]